MDKDLKEFVDDKIASLDKFYDKVVDAEVFLKVQKTSEKENKITEVKLNVPGDEMMVKKLSRTFEEGISLAVGALKRNLEKLKAKQRNH
jgi:putative sigma-54 modulation protein